MTVSDCMFHSSGIILLKSAVVAFGNNIAIKQSTIFLYCHSFFVRGSPEGAEQELNKKVKFSWWPQKMVVSLQSQNERHGKVGAHIGDGKG